MIDDIEALDEADIITVSVISEEMEADEDVDSDIAAEMVKRDEDDTTVVAEGLLSVVAVCDASVDGVTCVVKVPSIERLEIKEEDELIVEVIVDIIVIEDEPVTTPEGLVDGVAKEVTLVVTDEAVDSLAKIDGDVDSEAIDEDEMDVEALNELDSVNKGEKLELGLGV